MNVENITLAVSLFTAAYTLASMVIRLTPTKKDDIVLNNINGWRKKLLRILEIILLSKRQK